MRNWEVIISRALRLSGNVISAESQFLKENDDMAWTLLVVAGFFEIVWATLLKFTDGFTKVWPSVGTVVAMGISMVCMSFALRDIPMGTAYVVWTGIGAVGTVILGIVLFDEPKNAVRLAFIALIILGIVGLKLSSPS
jgi:quaternary ammonium compound-resistance protein SugE